MTVWTFATWIAYIYGIILLGFCGWFVLSELNCWLRERREDMRAGRVVRLIEDYTIAPEAACLEPEEFEDFFDMVDLSDDSEWIKDGIELLSIHATFGQRPDDEIKEAA